MIKVSLDKGIENGKEHRKQYYGAKAVDKECRNHGSDDWAIDNRTHKYKKQIKEYESDDEELQYMNKSEINRNKRRKHGK